jgi:hypothetical protein
MSASKTFNLVVGSGAGFVGPRVCSMYLSTGDTTSWLNGLYLD